MKRQSWLAFSIDRNSSEPVFEQICSSIRTQAISGDLTEGSRLSPTRVLAAELGVSRSTVVTAYEQLLAEGYIEGVPGSGYTVCRIGAVELDADKLPATRHIEREEMIPPKPFQAGQPDMRLFPHRQWAKTIARVCRTSPEAMVIAGSSLGNFPLREAVAQHVSEWRGIDASPHQIMITAGSGDALEICIRALTKTGERIGLEDPGYPPLRNFVLGLGLHPEYLKIGPNGVELPGEIKNGKSQLVVLTPSHQYPLGGALAPSRRLEFINWAERENAWIIEDDYDSEFRYAGRPIPAMAGFDKLNRTIYVGSFSKIFSNSLRLGYIVIPGALIERFKNVVTRFGVKASLLPQQPLAEFISSGEFYRHLRRVRRIYDARRRFLLKELTSNLSDFGSFEDHQAGMQIAFHLTDKLKDTDIEQRGEIGGITVKALSRFGADNITLNGLLIGTCGFSEEELEAGVSTLASILGSKA